MKKFEIITETDARVLERGETVMLIRGGHITPLAQDTLKERRVTVVREGETSPDDASLAPRADIRTVAGASDHTGVKLRQTIIALESDKYAPSLLLALRLARVFDVKVEEVFEYPNGKRP